MARYASVILAALVLSFGQTGAGGEPKSEIQKKWDAIPVPAKTPFDADARKKGEYLVSYRDGYTWAHGTHLACPTNPADHNLHAIRGWVEGWQAGVKAGGQSDLPAKYAPYLAWRDAGK